MDAWAAGEKYEPYVGRWSRLVARDFLAWLAQPAGLRWLDVGCGTGALTQAVLDRTQPHRVLGVDPSPAFLRYAAGHVPGAAFAAGDAQALPVADDGFDALVSGLALNFVPDRSRALAEMQRAVRPGGTVAVYVWDYQGGMELMQQFWEAAVDLEPAAARHQEGSRFDFCRPGPLRALFADAGLADVEVEGVVVPTVFTGFDDYWTPFLGATGPAPAYTMSLPDEKRAALREALRARLPTDDDGTIRLTARAWAVRGSCG
jgi:ubiquinone/menaquinone biosynthesis C-methylase UbiE